MARARRRGRPLGEYFLAGVGLLLLAFVVGVAATSGSCKIRLSSQVGDQPAQPRATPLPTR